MFLNYIKDYLKKIKIKNSLENVKNISAEFSIQTVGVLVDETYFFKKEDLLKALISKGISEKKIKIIVYRDKIKKHEIYSQPTFSIKDLNWKAKIINPVVNNFIDYKFDLLISYYDVEKAILLDITNNSKALFKVGFSTIDKRLNHFMINTNTENYSVFVNELFRYLKILNKI